MSRVGKLPIAIPSKVEVILGTNNLITVKGPMGMLSQIVDPDIVVKIDTDAIQIERPTDQKRHKCLHGLYRALIANMIKGVSEGYLSQMELYGVGYRISSTGQLLELALGYSHPIVFSIPQEVKLETRSEKGQQPTLILKSNDKYLLGQVAAKIRSFRLPEPYKGKGVRFFGEEIRRKAGKAGGKSGGKKK